MLNEMERLLAEAFFFYEMKENARNKLIIFADVRQ